MRPALIGRRVGGDDPHLVGLARRRRRQFRRAEDHAALAAPEGARARVGRVGLARQVDPRQVGGRQDGHRRRPALGGILQRRDARVGGRDQRPGLGQLCRKRRHLVAQPQAVPGEVGGKHQRGGSDEPPGPGRQRRPIAHDEGSGAARAESASTTAISLARTAGDGACVGRRSGQSDGDGAGGPRVGLALRSTRPGGPRPGGPRPPAGRQAPRRRCLSEVPRGSRLA